MKPYKEPDWQELDEVFDGDQRDESIADPNTGMVSPNQADLELFIESGDELTAFGKHLTETEEGCLATTPDGMGFTLRDRQKTRRYWEDRARVFAQGQNELEEHFASEDAAETENSQQDVAETEDSQQDAEATDDSAEECPKCGGSGLIDEESLCVTCDGYGVLQIHDK